MSLQQIRDYFKHVGPTGLTLRGVEEMVKRSRRRFASLPGINNLHRQASITELRSLQAEEEGIQDIIHTTRSYRGYGLYRGIEPQQIMPEFARLLDLVNEHEPSNIVEIGTAEGGTFYCWNRLESTKYAISIDLPGGIHGGGYPEQRVPFYDAFSANVDSSFIRGDSQSVKTKLQVEHEFGDEIDFLWIDGDHRYEGVKRDFELYSELVAEDGIIALHDIVEHPYHQDCEVDEFWSEVSSEYESREIVADSDWQTWGGIGVIWP